MSGEQAAPAEARQMAEKQSTEKQGLGKQLTEKVKGWFARTRKEAPRDAIADIAKGPPDEKLKPPPDDLLTPIDDVPDAVIMRRTIDTKTREESYEPVEGTEKQLAKLTVEAYRMEQQRIKQIQKPGENARPDHYGEYTRLAGGVNIQPFKEGGGYKVDFKTTDVSNKDADAIKATTLTVDTRPPDLTRPPDESRERYIIGQTQEGEYKMIGVYNALFDKHRENLPAHLQEQGGLTNLGEISFSTYDKTLGYRKDQGATEGKPRFFIREDGSMIQADADDADGAAHFSGDRRYSEISADRANYIIDRQKAKQVPDKPQETQGK